MKGEKLSLLQRCIKWREANIKEEAIYSDIKLSWSEFSQRLPH